MITAKNERQIVMYSGFSYNGISEDVLAMVIRTNLGNSIDDNVPRMLQAAAYNTAQSHDALNIKNKEKSKLVLAFFNILHYLCGK